MSNEKKIEIPAMPEKYRLMLEMLPEEPAGSKEEQAVRWKLRSTILEAYSAELMGKDVGGGVAILALLSGMLKEEAEKREDEKPKQGAEKTPDQNEHPAEGIDGEAMLRVRGGTMLCRAAGRRMRMVQPDPGAGQQRRREGGMDEAGHGRRAHAPHAQPVPPGGQDRDGVHRGVRGGYEHEREPEADDGQAADAGRADDGGGDGGRKGLHLRHDRCRR